MWFIHGVLIFTVFIHRAEVINSRAICREY